MSDNFKNILVPRDTKFGILKFMSRTWIPQKVYFNEKLCSPQKLKTIVAQAPYIESIIEEESNGSENVKEKLKQEVLQYLEEIGYDKKMHIVRWMGIFFLKVSFMMKIGIFVNESPIHQLKATMGSNPVLFLPTHRSYADFCLMTYLCYHYDIELPVVAAGTDFYSMAVVGRSMRETGAFYIRRTMAGAPLYAATLRQYVHSLVNTCAAPVEFFLEGTRSRGNKALAPKYGMLSMMLTPLFLREVSDVTVVPVNISYDRLMEHVLFAYEHLGVPKPKESTGSLVKALRCLNDHFGNIYINLGEPLSVKQFLNNQIEYSPENLKPKDSHNLTTKQFKQVQDLANHVITLQQKNTVATITNLMSLVLMQSLIYNTLLSYEEVISKLEWIIQVLQGLGATVFEKDVRSSVDKIMIVHKSMMKFDKDKNLRLVATPLTNVSTEVQEKMKGHTLRADTMVNAVPIIELQLYVNPVLHYLAPPAVVALIVHSRSPNREQLAAQYHYMRRLLKFEFFYLESTEDDTFNAAVQYCLQHGVITTAGDLYVPSSDRAVTSSDFHVTSDDIELTRLLYWSIWPVLTTMMVTATVLKKVDTIEHKQALKRVQARVEGSRCHPYCLSLESAGACLQGLVHAGALRKGKDSRNPLYETVPNKLEECIRAIQSITPNIVTNFDSTNRVIIDYANVSAKL